MSTPTVFTTSLKVRVSSGAMPADLLTLDSVDGINDNGSALSFVNNSSTDGSAFLTLGRVGAQRVDAATVRLDLGVADDPTATASSAVAPLLSVVSGAAGKAVGIGTLTPSSTLDVAGTLHVSGAIDLLGSIHAHHDVQIDGASVLGGTLSVSGATDLLGSIHAHHDVQIDGASVLGGMLSVTGTTDLMGTTHVHGNLTVDPDSSGAGGNLTIAGTATLGSNLTVNGNVGIGTSAPATRLHVAGVVQEGFRIQGSGSGPANVAYMSFCDSAGQQIGYVGDGSTLDTDIFLGSDTGNVTLATAAGRALVVTPAGNVGIGTPNPSGVLDVEGGTTAYTALAINTNSSHPYTLVMNRTDVANSKIQFWDNSGSLQIYNDSNTPIFTLTQAGNLQAEGTIWSVHGYKTGHMDLAENYWSEQDLEPGEVVCLDRESDSIARSQTANDLSVVGVISTAPGFYLNAESNSPAARMYPVALCGRIPCKVTGQNGPIRRGDLLTTSSIHGHAMKAQPIAIDGEAFYRPGTIIGKALESFEADIGMIEIFVALS
jgi:cytoskeletal protein CcmA (bactofilin family)